MADLIRFMHTADIHLGAQFAFLDTAKKQIRKTELMLCCESIFSLCRANSIKLLLLSGDIFENNSVAETEAAAFLRLIEETPDTTVVFSAGNHDPLTDNSPFMRLRLPDNLIVFGGEDECVELPLLKVRLYGRSFKSVYMSAKPFSITPPDDDMANILVIHGNLGADAADNYNPISKDYIRSSKMDYIALGHVHTFSGIQKEGSTFYAYSGCPEPHGFDESGDCGVICGELSKGFCNATLVKTALREHCVLDIDITDCQDNIEICNKIHQTATEIYAEKANKNLYKINLVGQIGEQLSLNTGDLVRRLEEELFYIKIKDKTELKIDLELLSKEASLKGMFTRAMLEKIKAQPQDEEKIKKALFLGLKAFRNEVKYREN